MRENTLSTSSTTESPSTSSQKQFRTGASLAMVGTFLFALKSILIKFAFSAGANAEQLLVLRLSLSAPFFLLMLWSIRRRAVAPPRKDVIYACVLGFLGYYLASLLDMRGLQLISAQLERLTLFTYPTMIAVLAWAFLGERITRSILGALALSYLGVFVMYSQEALSASSRSPAQGVLLVLASALSYSIYVVLAKKSIERIGSRLFTCYAMLGSCVCMWVHFGLLHGWDPELTRPDWLAYGLALAFGCTVIPSFLINEAIGRIGATRTTIIGSVGPVLTMLLAIFLLNEPTSWMHALGMILVVIGVSLVSIK